MVCRCSSISLFFYGTRLKSRYILSILVGFSLGFALSLVCLPLIDDCRFQVVRIPEHFGLKTKDPTANFSNSILARFDPFQFLNRQSRSVVDVTLVDYGSPDYEPVIHSAQELNQSEILNKETKKVIRSRYIADELGIREKLLVAVLTETNRLETFSLFTNQSLQEFANRVIFFTSSETSSVPVGMQIVSLNDKRIYLRPFYALKYLAEKFANSYDWFFIAPDNTFIRGQKVRFSSTKRKKKILEFRFQLRDFVNRISVNQDLYMGQAFDDVHAVYCYYGSGIILSGVRRKKTCD